MRGLDDLEKWSGDLPKSINVDPELMSGCPVFRGTRVPIKTLFDHLADETLEEFFDGFPHVERDQVIEVLNFARIVTLEKVAEKVLEKEAKKALETETAFA